MSKWLKDLTHKGVIMKNLLHILLATILLFSSVHDVYAKGGKKVEKGKVKNVIKLETILPESNAGKDCQFLYILKENSINKHSLPDLKLVLSVNLPQDTKGKAIDVGEGCNSPKAILVRAESDTNGEEEILLSYDENLQLVGRLALLKDVGADENENDQNDNNDENDHGDDNGD